ncbi:hypothetical protein K458DRAFT_157273 [Lentithecium fluviatile CBS 122367]|uniref:Uncharacterized protein n=1 Tax=Lentithecium fluviatile CBS 122367 TaxID=1168545 RepID=A0A6G1II84_9PLEO|nr:hypothetical protein K458DRAFT_157273 [Lentithecium fluviatile CBS 122367]
MLRLDWGLWQADGGEMTGDELHAKVRAGRTAVHIATAKRYKSHLHPQSCPSPPPASQPAHRSNQPSAPAFKPPTHHYHHHYHHEVLPHPHPRRPRHRRHRRPHRPRKAHLRLHHPLRKQRLLGHNLHQVLHHHLCDVRGAHAAGQYQCPSELRQARWRSEPFQLQAVQDDELPA